MKTSTYLALGGLGLGAYLLSRAHRVGAPGAGPLGFGPSTTSPGDDLIAGDFGGGYDWFLSFGARPDVCDLPDSRHDAWTEAQKACVGQFHAGRAQSFYDKVWAPASRVPITSLTKADFRLALAFLANKLTRRGMPWTYGQSKAVNDWNDDGAVQFANGVDKYLLPIVNALTFGLLNVVVEKPIANAVAHSDAGANAGLDQTKTYSNIQDITAAYQDVLLALPSVTDAGENDLVIEESAKVGSYDPTDPVFATDIQRQAWDSPFINAAGPSLDFGFDPIVFPFGKIYYRCQLFRSANSATGWDKPWVCAELGYPTDGGDGSKITDKTAKAAIIAKQARLYRTLDVLGAMLKPDTIKRVYGAAPDADGNIDVTKLKVQQVVRPGLYGYKVGAVELWGCVLPATAQDHAIAIGDPDALGKGAASSTYDRPTQTVVTKAEETYGVPDAPVSAVTAAAQTLSPSSNSGGSTSTDPAPAAPTKDSQIAARTTIRRR